MAIGGINGGITGGIKFGLWWNNRRTGYEAMGYQVFEDEFEEEVDIAMKEVL